LLETKDVITVGDRPYWKKVNKVLVMAAPMVFYGSLQAGSLCVFFFQTADALAITLPALETAQEEERTQVRHRHQQLANAQTWVGSSRGTGRNEVGGA
jgi:hypothetical protein